MTRRRPSVDLALVAGVVALFALFAGIVLPGIRRELQEPRSMDEAAAAARASVTSGWLDPAEAPPQKGGVLPPLNPERIMSPRPELLARGQELFRKNCVACHGATGRGDGPSAAALTPRPRDFTTPGGWTNGHRLTDIYRTISQGVKGTGMTAYDFLAPADRMALVHYVTSLGQFPHDVADKQALDALAEQFRSAGGRVPNRIPVSAAIQKLVAEAPPVAAVELSHVEPRLRSLMWDPARIARTVAALGPSCEPGLFARSIAAGAPANGFAPEIATLDGDGWRALQRALATPVEER